jgi:hypothetical protein
VAVSHERYGPGMRRFVDLVLIALVLAVVGVGAYELGHRVDHTSNNLATQDSELNSTTGGTTRTTSSDKHRTEIIVGGALAGTVVLIVLGSLASSLIRSRKREYWRAS